MNEVCVSTCTWRTVQTCTVTQPVYFLNNYSSHLQSALATRLTSGKSVLASTTLKAGVVCDGSPLPAFISPLCRISEPCRARPPNSDVGVLRHAVGTSYWLCSGQARGTRDIWDMAVHVRDCVCRYVFCTNLYIFSSSTFQI